MSANVLLPAQSTDERSLVPIGGAGKDRRRNLRICLAVIRERRETPGETRLGLGVTEMWFFPSSVPIYLLVDKDGERKCRWECGRGRTEVR